MSLVSSTKAVSGEAWQRGPVILSWQDAKHSGERDGHNVVIHEFVHKLDMMNGRANGFPPMQPDMDPTRWTENITLIIRGLYRPLIIDNSDKVTLTFVVIKY